MPSHIVVYNLKLYLLVLRCNNDPDTMEILYLIVAISSVIKVYNTLCFRQNTTAKSGIVCKSRIQCNLKVKTFCHLNLLDGCSVFRLNDGSLLSLFQIVGACLTMLVRGTIVVLFVVFLCSSLSSPLSSLLWFITFLWLYVFHSDVW